MEVIVLGIRSWLAHAWNTFGRTQVPNTHGMFWGYKPDRVHLSITNERSIVASVYTRIANDAAAYTFNHVRTGQNGRYEETIDSGLNECLTIQANIDQSGREFVRDFMMTLMDEGCAAVVIADANKDPLLFTDYEVRALRVGKIIEWYPRHVKIRLYNDNIGDFSEVVLPKKIVAIAENPFYAVMNERNSTLRRLVQKLNLLDVVDENNSSGKLDVIIQFPFSTRSEAQKIRAEERRKTVEEQLARSKYGIAYADATEHITQLNRPVENNLLEQVRYLTEMFYNQLGISEDILNGKADEEETTRYYTRTVDPFVVALVDALKRTFLTKTARTQGQSIMAFRDPFKLTTAGQLAEMSDKLTRNEILSSNEIRAIIGYKPDKDPRADELRNKNLNSNNDQLPAKVSQRSVEVMNDRKDDKS